MHSLLFYLPSRFLSIILLILLLTFYSPLRKINLTYSKRFMVIAIWEEEKSIFLLYHYIGWNLLNISLHLVIGLKREEEITSVRIISEKKIAKFTQTREIICWLFYSDVLSHSTYLRKKQTWSRRQIIPSDS